MVFTPQTKEGSCFTQEKRNTLSLRTAAVSRRHSTDGMISSRSGRGDVDADRFHPYQRQFSDGAVTECLQQCSSSFSSLHEVCSHSHSSDMPPSWDQYNGSIQVSILMILSFYPSILIKFCTAKSSLIDLTQEDRQAKKKDPPHHSKKHGLESFSKHFSFIYLHLQNSYPELPGIPVDPPCFLSQSYPSYSSASPQQQVSVLLQALRNALEDMTFRTQVISNICIYDMVCTLDYNSGQVMISSVLKRSLLDCILTRTSPAPQNIVSPASHTRTRPHSQSFLSPFTHTGLKLNLLSTFFTY